jgi:hypothetical protein
MFLECLRKSRTSEVRLAVVATEIRTEYHQNTDPELCRHFSVLHTLIPSGLVQHLNQHRLENVSLSDCRQADALTCLNFGRSLCWFSCSSKEMPDGLERLLPVCPTSQSTVSWPLQLTERQDTSAWSPINCWITYLPGLSRQMLDRSDATLTLLCRPCRD